MMITSHILKSQGIHCSLRGLILYPSRQPIGVDIILMLIMCRNKVGPAMSTNQPIFEFVSTEHSRLGINFVQSTSNRCLNYVLGVMHSKTKSMGQDNSWDLCRINDTFSRLRFLHIISRDSACINTKHVVDPYFIHTNCTSYWKITLMLNTICKSTPTVSPRFTIVFSTSDRQWFCHLQAVSS